LVNFSQNEGSPPIFLNPNVVGPENPPRKFRPAGPLGSPNSGPKGGLGERVFRPLGNKTPQMKRSRPLVSNRNSGPKWPRQTGLFPRSPFPFPLLLAPPLKSCPPGKIREPGPGFPPSPTIERNPRKNGFPGSWSPRVFGPGKFSPPKFPPRPPPKAPPPVQKINNAGPKNGGGPVCSPKNSPNPSPLVCPKKGSQALPRGPPPPGKKFPNRQAWSPPPAQKKHPNEWARSPGPENGCFRPGPPWKNLPPGGQGPPRGFGLGNGILWGGGRRGPPCRGPGFPQRGPEMALCLAAPPPRATPPR